MPRDLIAEAAVAVQPDMTKPTLPGLGWLLRHQEEWPNHRWKFDTALQRFTTTERHGLLGLFIRQHCGTSGCAMGVAILRWQPSMARGYGVDSEDALAVCRVMFGLEREPALQIFWAGAKNICVTPTVVADRIDDYLAGREIRYLVAGDVGAESMLKKSYR